MNVLCKGYLMFFYRWKVNKAYKTGFWIGHAILSYILFYLVYLMCSAGKT